MKGSVLFGREVTRMIRMKHQLNIPFLVLAIQFRISIIMADERAANDTFYSKYAEVIARAIVSEISGLAQFVSCAKHLVVTVDNIAVSIDDVEAVMRFVVA